MTRFEIIQQFSTDERTHRNHLILFLLLTEMWVVQGAPESVELDLPELLRILRGKRSTVLRWLQQLEQFGYIDLRRGVNQYERSTVRLTIGRAPTERPQSDPRRQEPTRDATEPDETATNQPDQTKAGHHVPVQDARRSARTPEMQSETCKPGSGHHSGAAQPGLVNNTTHLQQRLTIPEKGNLPTVSDGKRVKGKNQRGHRCAFADSPLASLPAFVNAFTGDASIQGADLTHYHARVSSWRDKSGNVPTRADWLSTARTFILNDIREGKLIATSSSKPLNSHVSRNHRTDSIIEPPPDTTGRRFGRF